MQDVNQQPPLDPRNNTTNDPGLHEPGMDAMSPEAGNPSSDADGGDTGDMTDKSDDTKEKNGEQV